VEIVGIEQFTKAEQKSASSNVAQTEGNSLFSPLPMPIDSKLNNREANRTDQSKSLLRRIISENFFKLREWIFSRSLQQDQNLSERIGEINKQILLLNKTFNAIKLVEYFLADTIEPDTTSELRGQFDTDLQKTHIDKDDILKSIEQYNHSKRKEDLQKIEGN
jgi:hypothetical protein